MRCDLCGVEVADTDEAIKAGWEPSYYDAPDADYDCLYPICGECARDRCEIVEGEMTLKPVAVRPSMVSEYGRYLPPKYLFARG